MSDYVSRQYLLNEYDRQHQGPPGGARKIIAEAPAEDVVPYSIDPDGTLTVTVPKGTKRIGRILIEEDGTQYGGLFYPDTGGCFLSSMERSEQDG